MNDPCRDTELVKHLTNVICMVHARCKDEPTLSVLLRCDVHCFTQSSFGDLILIEKLLHLAFDKLAAADMQAVGAQLELRLLRHKGQQIPFSNQPIERIHRCNVKADISEQRWDDVPLAVFG